MNINLHIPLNHPADPQQIIVLQQREIERMQQHINYLEELVRQFKIELFGRKTEKNYPPQPNQIRLFPEMDEQPIDIPKETVVVPEHTRTRSGRKPLPKDLPRIEVVHDIPEEEKTCGCGAHLSVIGREISEKLDYVPAKIQVIRNIRIKYACRACEGVETEGPTVKIAPPPPQLIPKSNATEGLLAHIAVSKFADALPLYRQEKMFARLGIDLPRATMANWLVQAAQKCLPLVDLLQKEIRSGQIINVDETPVQVLNEPGRENTTKSYMWVYIGGQLDSPAILYQYHPTRSGDVALEFLKTYEGYVQSDAFAGYEKLSRNKGVIQLGCWAHARRGFVKVVNVHKKDIYGQKPKGLADEALTYIAGIYRVEKEVRGLPFDEICRIRQEKALPILTSFETWLEDKKDITPPKGLLGKAIHYTLDNWSKLIAYLEDGRLKPDNNVAENAIRPFVLGRKNWLFAGHPNGANASALFFSLIETAKANNLEPYAYLRCLFTKLLSAHTEDDYRNLLPRYIDRRLLARE